LLFSFGLILTFDLIYKLSDCLFCWFVITEAKIKLINLNGPGALSEYKLNLKV